MAQDNHLLRLFEVAKFGKTHKHYQHTVDKRTLYKQLVAGVGIDKLLKRFVKRESDELFKQRVVLTQHIVTSICANLLAVFYKVPRSNSARRILTYKGDDNKDKKVKEFEALLSKFNGTISWDDYLSTRFIDLGSVDPNSFVVLEWDAFDATRELIQPRPFEVTAAMAVDYKETNRILDYLIVKQPIQYRTEEAAKEALADTATEIIKDDSSNFKAGNRYTLYGKNQTYTLTQVHEYVLGQTQVTEDRLMQIGEKQYIKLGEAYYEYAEYTPHNCDAVPAMRVGWKTDLATNGETYVNPLHTIEPFLLKTIKTNSELDLVAALLAFPQLIRYAPKCPDIKCLGGVYENGNNCGTCGGTGLRRTAPSAQDAIELPLPKSVEELIPLGDLAKYLGPDVDIVKWQEEYVFKITDTAKRMLFNSETFAPKEVAETAHGRNLDMQNVYDTLYPFSIHFSKGWMFGVGLMAKLADRSKDLVFNHSFGKDFKLKTLDSLIQDLKTVDEIGDPQLKRHIKDDIAQIIYAENHLELMRYQLKEFYNPFSGKSETEIMYLLGSPLVPKRDKILYANSGSILDNIELRFIQKGVDFYSLKRTEQIAEIDTEIATIKEAISKDAPEPTLNLFDNV